MGISEDIEKLWKSYVFAKGFCPAFEKQEEAEKGAYDFPDFYKDELEMTVSISINADPGLKVGTGFIQETGHLISKLFILKLFSLLDSNELVVRKAKKKEGGFYYLFKDKSRKVPDAEYSMIPQIESFEILNDLSNKFRHGSGKYRKSDKKHRKLLKAIYDSFPNVDKRDDRTEWPLPIDVMLVPLKENIKKYANDVQKKINNYSTNKHE